MSQDCDLFIHASINMERWMSLLSMSLKDFPLIYLAIPGSHDSMTYGINKSSKLGPDASVAYRAFYPAFKKAIIRWSKTQYSNVTQQLCAGIRYFDLRVATKKKTDKLFFTHGLYSSEISEALNRIKDFVDSHPEEVVILDFQHFFGLSAERHQQLIQYLIRLFGPRLVSRVTNLETVTISSLSKLKQQVIVIYRDQTAASEDKLWLSEMLPTVWPRQVSTRGLIRFLEKIKRQPGTGFVHQAVITPNGEFIITKLCSNIRNKCAKPVLKDVLPVISKDFQPGIPKNGDLRSRINVVIADFIELNDNSFTKSIVNINEKLKISL